MPVKITEWNAGIHTAREFVLLREPLAHSGFYQNSMQYAIFGDNKGIDWCGPFLSSGWSDTEEEAWGDAALSLSLGWINDLPKNQRDYIHDLETRCDPAGDIQTIAILKETIAALLAKECTCSSDDFKVRMTPSPHCLVHSQEER